MNNRLRYLLGIEHAIIMGGMSAVGKGDLPSAVSNAGGLGLIGGGGMNLEEMKYQMDYTRSKTKKPWGVNFVAGSPSAGAKVELLVKEKPPVVSLGGILRTDAITPLKEAGIIVMAVVSSVKGAKRCVRAGADVIIVEGIEAGGHISDTGETTMVLTRRAAKEMLGVPLVTAGGIVDGASMAAALNLGADGVQMGTGFVCATESPVHPAAKEAFIGAKDQATVVTGNKLRVRSIKNSLTKNYQEIADKVMSGEVGLSALEDFESGKLQMAMSGGNIDDGYLMAGQCVSMVAEEQSVAEIIAEIMAECEKVLSETLHRL